MNRRSFVKDMLKAGVACTFLPGAGRIWKPVLAPAQRIVIPEFYYEQVLWARCYDMAYLDYMQRVFKGNTKESLVEALDLKACGTPPRPHLPLFLQKHLAA